MLPGLLALITAASFFGVVSYINVAEHPARIGLENRAALSQWGPAYKRGFAMQALLAILSGLLGVVAHPQSILGHRRRDDNRQLALHPDRHDGCSARKPERSTPRFHHRIPGRAHGRASVFINARPLDRPAQGAEG